LGRIPKVGEELRIGNCRILIHEAEPRSIRSVQLFREEKAPVSVEAPNLNLVS
jgi:magnesium and cobalt exporter, CNNM family